MSHMYAIMNLSDSEVEAVLQQISSTGMDENIILHLYFEDLFGNQNVAFPLLYFYFHVYFANIKINKQSGCLVHNTVITRCFCMKKISRTHCKSSFHLFKYEKCNVLSVISRIFLIFYH